MRKVKIVATIGPASDSEQALESLIRAGMNVARLNFSHGTHEQHQLRVAKIRGVPNRPTMPAGTLQDLQAPKLRVGKLGVPLQPSVGEEVCLYATNDEPPQNGCQLIPVDFRELFDSVQQGDNLLLDDGRLALAVTSAEGRQVHATVKVGGALSSHTGIKLAAAQNDIDMRQQLAQQLLSAYPLSAEAKQLKNWLNNPEPTWKCPLPNLTILLTRKTHLVP